VKTYFLGCVLCLLEATVNAKLAEELASQGTCMLQITAASQKRALLSEEPDDKSSHVSADHGMGGEAVSVNFANQGEYVNVEGAVPPPQVCSNSKFPYHALINGWDFCYTESSYATAQTGPCDSWCTTRNLAVTTPHCGQLCEPICTNPSFPYHAEIHGHDFCYTNPSYANAKTGPCDSWCTTRNLAVTTAHCGQLCEPCTNPSFPYHAEIHGDDFCYTNPSYANAKTGPCDSWCTPFNTRTSAITTAQCGKVC